MLGHGRGTLKRENLMVVLVSANGLVRYELVGDTRLVISKQISIYNMLALKSSSIKATRSIVHIKYDAEADTKNSLLLSIAKPCIGGVVYNLNKLSMIQCEYAKCLVEDVPKKNQPSSVCTNAKNFAACKMVIGEAYTLLNMRIFDEYVAEIQKWFYQPGPKAAQFAVSGACQFACSKSAMKAPGWNWLRLTCSGAKLFLEAQTVGEQKSSLKEFTNSLKPQESSCDIEKVREQFKTLTS